MAKSKSKAGYKGNVHRDGHEYSNKAPAKDAKKASRGEGGFRNKAMSNKR